MNKLIALVLLTTSALVNAEEYDLNMFTLSLDTKNVYRGETISDDVSFSFNFVIEDLFLDGLYVDFSSITTELTPISDSVNYKGDVGVGYNFDLPNFTGVIADVSLNYVINPVLRNEDYSELRGNISTDWSFLYFLDFYGHANYALNGLNDTYASAGIIMKDFLLDDLNIKVGTNFYKFDDGQDFTIESWNRNNYEVSANYRFWRNVRITGLYSVGRYGSTRNRISNEWNIGLKAVF